MSIPTDKFPIVPTSDYPHLRHQIRSGDILLCSGNSLFSKLIKRATGSIWSHVGFILKDKSIDRLMVFESVETIGVRTVPLSSYVYDYTRGSKKGYDGQILIARHAAFDESKIYHFSHKSVDLLGYSYDTLEIARIASRLALHWAGMRKKRAIIDNGLYICSEYAYECYKSIGIQISHDSGGFITPADFAKDQHINAVCAPQVS